MNFVSELFADICTDIAMGILLCNLILGKGKPIFGSCLFCAAFGTVFTISAVAAGLHGAFPLLIADISGLILSCTAFLFTLPKRTGDDKQ